MAGPGDKGATFSGGCLLSALHPSPSPSLLGAVSGRGRPTQLLGALALEFCLLLPADCAARCPQDPAFLSVKWGNSGGHFTELLE